MTAQAAVKPATITYVHTKGVDLMKWLEQGRAMIENPDNGSSIYKEHWNEVAVHKDTLRLKPHYERYMRLIQEDSLVVISAYNGEELIGYVLFITFYHLHYKDLLVANDDMYFIKKHYRQQGIGREMMQFAEKTLADMGVKFVQVRTKAHTAHEEFLKSLGYGPMDLCYCKVLEK